MPKTTRVLQKVLDGPLSLINQESDGPAVFDTRTDGVDLLCPCGQVLAHDVGLDQLWNIAIRCHSCGDIVACDPLPPGTPLPSPLVVLNYGDITETVNLMGQVLVGEAALVQRNSEIGERGLTFGRFPVEEGKIVLDSAHLRDLIEAAEAILKPELEKLRASSKRSDRSNTPSPSPHGLLRAITRLEAAEQSFAGPTPYVDLPAWAELRAVAILTSRWRGHPDFEGLRHGLVHEYEHTLILIAAATALEDWGTGVTLQPPQPGRRTPDLRLGARAHQEGYVEIKTPRPLCWPEQPIMRDEAAKIVKKAINKARTGKSGQLKRGLPSLLVIGGFHLFETDLNLLEGAANAYLTQAARQQHHRSVMAILLISIGSSTHKRFSATGEVVSVASRRFDVRVCPNPGYQHSEVAQLRILR